MATHPKSQLQIDLKRIHDKFSRPRRQIHKVPPQLRMRAPPSVYDPIFISLGPYHHGKSELHQAEEFKYLCVYWCTQGSETSKERLYGSVLNAIDGIRDCYAEAAFVNQYDDNALAVMMLLDTCFIVSLMENVAGKRANADGWHNFLGEASTQSFVCRDLMLLENQIPFFVLKLILNILYDRRESEELLQAFMACFTFTESGKIIIPREAQDPPIHFLEAYRRVVVEISTIDPDQQQHGSTTTCGMFHSCFKSTPFAKLNKGKNKKNNDNVKYASSRHSNLHNLGSVTNLKAKGIHFSPISSHSYVDVKFESYTLYGEFQLPVRVVNERTLVILSNMIAYELSPTCGVNSAILSYASLMKSLIQNAADVRELQSKGILMLDMVSDQEQVVQLFKNIDNFSMDSTDIYEDVMQRIKEHCNNKAKTWIADLRHGKLKNPWNIIALLSATLLLILTFLQTFYTIYYNAK